MTTLYKLTNQQGKTRGGMSWFEGCINSVEPCNAPRLCSGDVLHAYRNLNLGLLLNPQHADISNPRVWKCDGNVVVEDWGKTGCFDLEVIEELIQPEWYQDTETRNRVVIQFAILCA